MGFCSKKQNGKNFWQKHIDDKKRDELKAVKKFCRKKLLKYNFIDDSMDRSSNYRNQFFKKNKGIFGTNIYVCAYCGKFLRKNQVRVDHIIPVYRAKNYKLYKKLLLLRRIKNVNDVRNLTASCEKCNSRKSSNGGLWILRGWFGRSAFRVILKEIIFLIFGSILLYLIYNIINEYFKDYIINMICRLIYE